MTIRPLHTIDEFRQVLALEKAIWGYEDSDDAVGIPVFVITVKRGGILLGAFDGDRMIGFVYSLAGLKHGRPMQWSHMLGVVAEYRATGIGRELKLEQRRIAIEMGLDLMEWTYDPLVAVNAHLNFNRLGVVVEDYVAERLRRLEQPAAQGHADRPVHRAVVDAVAARREARSPGRRRRIRDAIARPAGWPTPSPTTGRGWPARAWIWRAWRTNWRSRFPPASTRCSSASPTWGTTGGWPRGSSSGTT